MSDFSSNDVNDRNAKSFKKKKNIREILICFTLDAQICLFPLYTQYYSPGIKFL